MIGIGFCLAFARRQKFVNLFCGQLSPFFRAVDSVRVREVLAEDEMDLGIRGFLEAVFITDSNPKGMPKGNVKGLVRENSKAFFFR